MVAISLPHLCREVSRHGRIVWYVRIGQGRRVRLDTGPNDPGFAATYEAALVQAGSIAIPERKPSGRSWIAMARAWQASPDFHQRAPVWQRRASVTIDRLAKTIGGKAPDCLDQATVLAIMDGLPPGSAGNLLRILKALYKWAMPRAWLASDPTTGLSRPETAGEGFTPWTEADVAMMRTAWPLDSQPRLVIELALNSLARRDDLVRIAWAGIDDAGRLRFTPGKTSRKTGVRVDLPILPDLADALAAHRPKRGSCQTVLQSGAGKPWASGNSLGMAWQRWRAEIGATISLHGARKLGATRLAEAGATPHELMAAGGWTTLEEPVLYTEAANRARMADSGMARLASRTLAADPPAPDQKPK